MTEETCIRCTSTRLASISSKCSDRCGVNILTTQQSKDGYAPDDMAIGGGDYIQFCWCLDCGQIQDKFPLAATRLETAPPRCTACAGSGWVRVRSELGHGHVLCRSCQ